MLTQVRSLCLVFSLTLVGCSLSPPLPKGDQGRMDLSSYDFAVSGSLALTGPWEFYWDTLLAPGDRSEAPTTRVVLPDGLWQGIPLEGKALPPIGCATYRLTVVLGKAPPVLALRLPEAFSACRVYLNGGLVSTAGTVGSLAEDSHSAYAPGLVLFVPRAGDNEVLVQVSNFKERRGGINRNLVLGLPGPVERDFSLSQASDLLLFGILAAMGIYHLILFALRRKDRSPLWFGLFCLVIAVRTLLYGERFVFVAFPGFPWELFQALDHLTFYWGIPLFAEYLRLIFVRDISTRFIRAYQALGVVFSLFLFFSSSVFNLTVVGYELVSAVALVYLLVVVGLALVRRREGALVTVAGVMLFLACGVNEILFNLGTVHTFNSLSLGLFLFLFSQAVLLAIRFSQAFTESERLGGRLLDTNQALRRFIPGEFFTLLHAREVTDIQLGDQVQKSMSVMFSDIRGFTGLAENLSSQETFRFLNSYYGRAGAVMRRHGGFIDKYQGDGFMTLFANRPDDALAAAVDLQRAVAEYNQHRATSGYPAITVGTGLHYGSLVLGTIGEPDRMDTTVISDAVNLASRLEGLTKLYGKGTIVSLGFLDSLEEPDDIHWRYLGMLRVPGRREPLEVVHVYDGLPPEEWTVYEEGKPAFEEALALYRQGAFPEAQAAFGRLAMDFPEDPAIGVYLTRISLMIKAGLTQDWDGVDTILTK